MKLMLLMLIPFLMKGFDFSMYSSQEASPLKSSLSTDNFNEQDFNGLNSLNSFSTENVENVFTSMSSGAQNELLRQCHSESPSSLAYVAEKITSIPFSNKKAYEKNRERLLDTEHFVVLKQLARNNMENNETPLVIQGACPYVLNKNKNDGDANLIPLFPLPCEPKDLTFPLPEDMFVSEAAKTEIQKNFPAHKDYEVPQSFHDTKGFFSQRGALLAQNEEKIAEIRDVMEYLHDNAQDFTQQLREPVRQTCQKIEDYVGA